MRRLLIIVEGQSEEEFVNISLRNYFIRKGIYNISAIKIQTSRGQKGGFVRYDYLKNNLKKILLEPNIIVSTLLDFFQIPTSVPNYKEMNQVVSTDDKIDVLLKGMRDDINDSRFIPYIQKYEFEALLFSSNEGFKEMYDKPQIYQSTKAIIDNYDNPEEINNHPNTAPSKRLINILAENEEKYDKVYAGNLIVETIGIETILEKCPRFKAWIDHLEKLMLEELK